MGGGVLSAQQVADFDRDGFLVVRGFADAATCERLVGAIDRSLNPPLGPLELEAELGYPGAPAAVEAAGGSTPRRLLHAFSRGEPFRDWARAPRVVAAVRALCGGQRMNLVQAHHNCIMTKYPRFGSETGWHQDIRYWRYARPALVNVWLALGPEGPEQGGMRVIPGSHRLTLDRGRFDDAQFLRTDLAQNAPLLSRARDLSLQAGDVLFFHCCLLHAAGRNRSARVKRSLVFTYNPADNNALAGSRSARLPEVPLEAEADIG